MAEAWEAGPCTQSSWGQGGAGGGEVAGVPEGVPFPPLVPKALLYGCDKSAGTFPGDVGGVVIPQTVDGLQRLVYKANQNVSITREHQVLHQVSSQCSV